MSIIKRISATLTSRIEQVVGELENHDAVIQATLREVRSKVAEARIRLSQVQREAEQFQSQHEEQKNLAARWRQRAIVSAEMDESKALECLRRAHQCDQQVQRLLQAGHQYEQTAHRLEQDIARSEERLRTLKQKHTLMRARQSSGVALAATHETEGDVIRQVEDSFDRWEISIAQMEMTVDHVDTLDTLDTLEREFTSSEEAHDLRQELTDLLKGERA